MPKPIKILLWVFILPGIVLLLALWSVPNSLYLRLFRNSVVPSLERQGIHLDWGSGTIHPFALALRRITLSIPSKLLAFAADECQATLRPTALLRGNVAVGFHCMAYAGEMTLNAALSSTGEPREAQVSIQRFDLARHPQISALGLRSALLSVDAPLLQFTRGGITGRAQVSVDKIEKPDASTLPKFVTGLSIPIPVPPLRGGTLKLPLALNGNEISARGIEFSSSLGEFSGDYSFTPKQAQGQFIVSLTTEGGTAIGQWLPIVSNHRLTAEDRRFSLSISGSPRAPRVEYKKG